MMNDIVVKVSKETRYVTLEKTFLSNDGENLQDNLIFKFEDEFVDGIGRLEYDLKGDKNFITMEKGEDYYSLPIKSILTKKGLLYLQLVVTQSKIGDSTPIFKSNKFYVTIGDSIDATEEAPEGYEQWIEIANEKLAEMDNLNIEASKTGTVTTVTITDKSGNESSVEINDGQDGSQGERGPQGLPGEKGETGATGPANTLSVGTVIKGTDASATITGTAPNQTLNLVLPKGDKGDQGEPGTTPDMSNYYTKNEVNNLIPEASYLGKSSDYNINNPLDITNLKKGLYYIDYDIDGNIAIWIKATINGNVVTSTFMNPSYDSLVNNIIYIQITKTVAESVENDQLGYIYYTRINENSKYLYFQTLRIKRASGGINASAGYYTQFKFVTTDGVQEISGVKQFRSLPECSIVPTQNYHLVNKKYVDDTVGDISTILESLVTVSQGGE